MSRMWEKAIIHMADGSYDHHNILNNQHNISKVFKVQAKVDQMSHEHIPTYS